MVRIQTERLILREIEISDADAFIPFMCRPDYFRYISGELTPEKIIAKTQERIEYNKAVPRLRYCLTITKTDDGAVIGDIRGGVEKDSRGNLLPGVFSIGYGLDPAHQGHGYMAEALRAMTAFLHDTIGAHRVEAAAVSENPASWRTMEKAGFVRDAELRYRVLGHGKYWPLLYQYASVRPDLAAKSEALLSSI
jgi:RimJ/RimL family protein N-acetyltransferase